MDQSVLNAADAPLQSLIDDATDMDDIVVLIKRLNRELQRLGCADPSILVLTEGEFARCWTTSPADNQIQASTWMSDLEATVEGQCAADGLERRLAASEIRLPAISGEEALADRPLLSPVKTSTEELLILPLLSARGSLGSWAIQASDPLDGRALTELRAIAAIVTMVLEKFAVLRETDERQAQLERVNASLESTNSELETVARMASSELHQPLGQIRNYANRLGDADEQLTERELDYLGRITGAGSRMQRLIADLLTFSRVSTADAPMSEVDLNTVVSEALMDLELTISDVGGVVNVGELGVASGNSTQLRQLFQNLIGNAIKYRRADVSPVVMVRAVDSPLDSIAIEVQDNGIGFEPQFVDRIFKPFQRLHGRGTFDGSGIGLAVCRRIVERHGGELTARSEPGQGSTFVATFARGGH